MTGSVWADCWEDCWAECWADVLVEEEAPAPPAPAPSRGRAFGPSDFHFGIAGDRDDQELRIQILEEDELVLNMIKAFVERMT